MVKHSNDVRKGICHMLSNRIASALILRVPQDDSHRYTYIKFFNVSSCILLAILFSLL
jgi:hypothetical protein